MSVRALVVDDEPMAREYIKLLLSRTDDVEVIAECGNASECLKLVADLRPNVVFLDITMPGDSGMDAAKALSLLSDAPLIVFITGYDEYALPAFEVAAVDYLMKPLDQERLERALQRVRARLAAADTTNGDHLALGKLAIRNRDGFKLIDASDICYIRTSNRKTRIHTNSADYLSHYTLTELEYKLSGEKFFRANEGCLVNLERVKEILYYGPRTYELLLSEPADTCIPLSRSRAQELKELLDF